MKKKIISLFFCTLLISVVSSAGMNVNTKDDVDPTLVLVRIDITGDQINLPRDIEIVGSKYNEWIDIIIINNRLNELSNLGIKYDVLIWDVIKYDNLVRGQYHSLAEMEDILEDIANDHPDITELYSIGTTCQGRDIWCLEITDNPGVDEGEPGVFFMGLHHAREWPTLEICLHICNELTSGYGSFVNSNRIWVVPCVNPDGYYYCHDQGHDWRKNRRYFPEYGTYGVDLNRNYAGSSNGDPDGAWGSVGTGSITHYPDHEVYCGPEPFSEYETQAIRDIFLEYDIHATISWHTHGELVLWPWGYSYSTTPDNTYMKQVGEAMAQEITRQSGSGHYTPQQAANLYPTTGDTIDWAYGYSHYILGRPTFAYTIEACSSFHPSAGVLDQVCDENFDGALVLLEEAEDIRDTVTRRVIPPVIDEMEEPDIDGDYTVSWDEQNPDANPTKFQLDELIGPYIDIDDAESGTGFWSLDDFSLSNTRYHSPSLSYKSGNGNNKVFSMVTVDPIPVTEGMNLEFWTWYDIEYNYDYAMVEVSLDGRSYDLLGGFTGSSSTWQQKQYPLTNYTGKSIFIRFRYITDDYTLGEGIYFDDITPVVEWDSITTLSDSITTNYYDVTGKVDGIYYYRVKGYNSEHGWGDFSILEDMEVDIFDNDPPETPTINGQTTGTAGQDYEYTFRTTDPDGDQVYYYIEWGDGDIIEWDGPHNSDQEIKLTHSWAIEDTYTIRAKAKDVWDYESGWGTLKVTMPRNRATYNSLFLRFLERFPILQLLFQRLGL